MAQRAAFSKVFLPEISETQLAHGTVRSVKKPVVLSRAISDWKLVSLESSAEIIMGRSPIGSSYNRDGKGAPLINGPTEFMENHPIKIQWTTAPTKFCKKGDLLLCVRGSSTGRINTADDAYCIGRGVAAIRAIPTTDPTFISYQVKSRIPSLLKLTTGSTFPSIDRKSIGAIEFLFPPLCEQCAIAEVLSDMDCLIQQLDLLTTKKRALRQATMEQLFSGRRRLPGFNDKWEMKRLEEVMTHCSSGATPSRSRPEFYQGSIRWVTSGELNFNIIHDTAEKITQEAVDSSHLRLIPANTFLMAITGLEADGTRGACGILGKESTTNQSCMAIFTTDALTVKFLFYYYIYAGKALASQYCQGTKQQSYTAKTVKLLPIPIPSVREQVAITTILSDIDVEIGALERQLAKTRDLKQGMMEDLLTGRIRLV